MLNMDETMANADWTKSVDNLAAQFGIPIEDFTLERFVEVAPYWTVKDLMKLPYIRRWLIERGEWEEHLEKYAGISV